jgi:hypothetical protein
MFTWDNKFNVLATYNSEVYRGIVHNDDYRESMSILQAEYDARLKAAMEASAQPTTNAGTPFLLTLWNWIIGKNSVRA